MGLVATEHKIRKIEKLFGGARLRHTAGFTSLHGLASSRLVPDETHQICHGS